MAECKQTNHEEAYYEALGIAEQLQSHLEHYEAAVKSRGISLPYSSPVASEPIVDDFDDRQG